MMKGGTEMNTLIEMRSDEQSITFPLSWHAMLYYNEGGCVFCK